MLNDEECAKVFYLLSNAKRLQVLQFLRDGPAFVEDFRAAIDISKCVLSKNLLMFIDAGFIECKIERRGSNRKRRHYHLVDTDIIQLIDTVKGELYDV